MKNESARAVALKVLYDIEKDKAYLKNSLDKNISEYDLISREKALCTELAYGVTRWKSLLDYNISEYSRLKSGKLSIWIKNILRMGMYQLFLTDKIPESASVNESVILAKKFGHKASAGFVNAVLRNAQRNGMRLPEKGDFERFLSVKYSHPEWMVRKWRSRWDDDFVSRLLDANNKPKGLTIRVNTEKVTPNDLKRVLFEQGIASEAGRYFSDALILKNPSGIASINEFAAGYFQVQDEAAMLAVSILNPQQGELIIDVCAAPGGKTVHISHLMKNNGNVIAFDIYDHKLRMIEDNCRRMGIKNVITLLHDASKTNEAYAGKADRVLVDAPCTGLGTIRHKPDIKWSRKAEDITELSVLQLAILNASSKYVKKGGCIVYSTCTTEYEENNMVVKEFIKQNSSFAISDIKDCIPDELAGSVDKDGTISVYPHVNGTDGFFTARMIRVK